MNYEEKITNAEWEVMRVVWTSDKVTSKEINEVLKEKTDWKPSTTKTFIGRLVKKGILNMESTGNRYLYSAAVSEEEGLKVIIEGLFDHICNKQIGNTIAHLIMEATLSHTDAKMLTGVIERKKQDAVEEVDCNCVPGQCNCKSHH